MLDLTEGLRKLFGTYGNILDLVASKRMSKRGQAFIVFDKLEDAQKAMNELQVLTFLVYLMCRVKITLVSL